VFVRRGRKMGVVHTPVVQTLRRLRQEVGEFKASLGYSVRPCPLSLRQGERERERKREREKEVEGGRKEEEEEEEERPLCCHAMPCAVLGLYRWSSPSAMPCKTHAFTVPEPRAKKTSFLYLLPSLWYPVIATEDRVRQQSFVFSDSLLE
jgi:hypothetical protein